MPMPPSPRSHEPTAPAPEAEEQQALRLLDRHRDAVTAEMRAVLAEWPFQHFAPMRYHLGWEDEMGRPTPAGGGKMLRPALCLLCCEAMHGDWRRALPAAAALEFLHNFSLIHDDIEDDSPYRHGRETVWRLWGQAQAINVGDGMFALAHLALLRLADGGVSPDQVMRAAAMLNEASLRLCEGQHLDLTFEKRAEVGSGEYLSMVEGKSASLMAASTGIGAVVGNASSEVVESLREFGRLVGFAFQIRDDILGIWGDAAETGKPAGDDVRARKKSFPIVFALEHAVGADHQTLRSIYGADTMSSEGVLKVCAILERSGALAESERVADDYARRALAQLREVRLRAKQRLELERLAWYVARRRR
jgi:geranylgeranyl diphosphate synthase type I